MLINQWNNRFYNALQDRDWDTFVSELLFFCVLAAAFIVLAVYQLYLNQWLLIRWRRWMTQRYLERLARRAPTTTACSCSGDAADNPDQRIAEDIKLFVEKRACIDRPRSARRGGDARSPSSSSCGCCRRARRCTLFGIDWAIPGYLVWAALIYAIVGTALTHWIGRPLIALNFKQQRYEADFRFNLVRVRENSEQIALLDGETGGEPDAARSASRAWSPTGC